jgi:importin subunit beta-1
MQEIARQQDYSSRWLALDQNTKALIKNQALSTLSSPTQRAGGLAAMVVAAIAAIELPQLQWNDLIDVLMGFINNQEQVNLRISTLSTIGFICEQIVCQCSNDRPRHTHCFAET